MRNRYGKIFVACIVATLLNLGSSAVATAQTYTITDVGTSSGMGTSGGVGDDFGNNLSISAINNLGQVVINVDDHAYVWQDGVMTDLDPGGFSLAYGINDAGQVAGFAITAGKGLNAFLWQKDSQGNYSMTDLDRVGIDSRAFGINAVGQVVGVAGFALRNTFADAALWQNGVMTDLGSLVGATLGIASEALGVNDAGQVVGWTHIANVDQDQHAFLWQNEVMTDLGTLGGAGSIAGGLSRMGSIAFGINAAGQVVGYASTASEEQHAALWQKDSQGAYSITDLRTLGSGESRALGINAAGQIVGVSDNLDVSQRATMWQKDSQGVYSVITDLNTLLPPGSGWNLVAARAINDRGQIIGTAVFDGLNHMYLLSPVELLDPVPELLTGPAVTTDPRDKERLASKGRPVLGVAADGVAQLVIRIPAKSAGEQITLTVLGTQQVESSSQNEDGAVADVFSPSFRSSVTVTAVPTAKGPMAFALYLAPRDFTRICNSSPCQSDVDATSRQVTLQLQTGTIPIKIVRPPVMLIHGLWSGPKAWDDFLLTFNPRFQTFRADYKDTNGESIQINTYNVEAELDIDLREFKSVSKVAAVQFDLITHSMGGLLARNLATLNSYRRVSNYRKGDIHKLVTLDTPHLGSQLATNLDAASPRCRFVFNLIGKKVGGAVKDLEYRSPVITKLLEPTTPIKARLIAGQATRFQEVESEAVFRGLTSAVLLGLCSSLLPSGGFPALFKTIEDPDGHSDLIVSVISQLGKTIAVGRQNPPADAPYIEIDGIIHTRIPFLFQGTSATDSPTIGRRVIDLLNTSVAIPDFGDILP